MECRVTVLKAGHITEPTVTYHTCRYVTVPCMLIWFSYPTLPTLIAIRVVLYLYSAGMPRTPYIYCCILTQAALIEYI